MSEYNRHRWAMEWMHGGGRDPHGRSLDDEIRIGKEDWMERQRVAQGGRIGLQSGQLVQPGPGRPGYSGVKELPDGGYSVRSKYKADLGNWPTGEKKAKTHYFDTKQEALDFKKEAKTQPIRATESSQKVQKIEVNG